MYKKQFRVGEKFTFLILTIEFLKIINKIILKL